MNDPDNVMGTAKPENQIGFEWGAPRSLIPQLRDDLASSGARLEDDSKPFKPPADEEADYAAAAFEPLLLIAGAIAIGYLADKIVTAVRNARHGGAVIDVRQNQVAIHANPAVPPGTLVVVNASGVQAIQKPESDTLTSILATGAFGS